MHKKTADRRSRLEMDLAILDSLARKGEPVRPSNILRTANLSWDGLIEHLKPLLASELVKPVAVHRPEGTGYALTPKGNEVLSLYTRLVALLRSNEVVAYPANSEFRTEF